MAKDAVVAGLILVAGGGVAGAVYLSSKTQLGSILVRNLVANTNNPQPGVSVSLDNGPAQLSDSDGEVTFLGVSYGTHYIYVTLAGYFSDPTSPQPTTLSGPNPNQQLLFVWGPT